MSDENELSAAFKQGYEAGQYDALKFGSPAGASDTPTVPIMVSNGHPRRIRLDMHSPAERGIRHMVDVVEGLGADVALTDAVILLDKARERVADFVDQEIRAGRMKMIQEITCPDCKGSGDGEADERCYTCHGSGKVIIDKAMSAASHSQPTEQQ